MRFVEKLVLGLWVGFIAASVAILASALPYIYTRPDDPMRCGSLGISTFVIVTISQTMMIIVFLTAIYYGGRACISATIKKRGPMVGFIVEVGAFSGSMLWVVSVFVGATIFFWFLEWLTILVQNPPPHSPNQSDIKACSQFIGEASKPPNFDPLASGLEYSVASSDCRKARDLDCPSPSERPMQRKSDFVVLHG
jgi:hypothetical protein